VAVPPHLDIDGELLKYLKADLEGDRQELLSWLNNLLQLNVTKVEQCGTGYVLSAYCLSEDPPYNELRSSRTRLGVRSWTGLTWVML
jgi:hypothetical protein